MELLVAAGALAMSALFFVLAGRFPSLAADPGGLALFPRAAAVFTGLASAAFLGQSILARKAIPKWQWRKLPSLTVLMIERRAEVISFAIVGALPFAIQWLGFVAAVGIFTALLLKASRVPLIPLAVTTVLTTVGIYLAYAVVLGAILPTGRLWD